MQAYHGRRMYVVAKGAIEDNKRLIRLQAVARGFICRLKLKRKWDYEARVNGAEQYLSVFKARWKSRNMRRDRSDVSAVRLCHEA